MRSATIAFSPRSAVRTRALAASSARPRGCVSATPRLATSADAALAFVLPKLSVTETTRLLLPAAIGTTADQCANASVDVAAMPFTVTPVMVFPSLAVPRTWSWFASVYETGVGKMIRAEGCDASICQLNEAGVASTLPAASIARTANVCGPLVNALNAYGLCPAVKAAPSRLTWNVAAISFELNENVPLAELASAAGELTNVVSGIRVSTVHVNAAGEASTFPAASRARTFTVWAPCARLLNVNVAATAAYAPPSTLASNTEPASVEEAVNVPLADAVTVAGVAESVVSGGVVSAAGGEGGGVLPPPPPPHAVKTSAQPKADQWRDDLDDITWSLPLLMIRSATICRQSRMPDAVNTTRKRVGSLFPPDSKESALRERAGVV